MSSPQQLVLVIEDQIGKRAILLDNIYYSIGRAPTNHIRLFDSFVSREHALLIRIPDEEGEGYTYRVFDGNSGAKRSTNGVFVNGQPIQSHSLRPQDRVGFGPQVKVMVTTLDQLPAQGLISSGSLQEAAGHTQVPTTEGSKESFSAA